MSIVKIATTSRLIWPGPRYCQRMPNKRSGFSLAAVTLLALAALVWGCSSEPSGSIQRKDASTSTTDTTRSDPTGGAAGGKGGTAKGGTAGLGDGGSGGDTTPGGSSSGTGGIPTGGTTGGAGDAGGGKDVLGGSGGSTGRGTAGSGGNTTSPRQDASTSDASGDKGGSNPDGQAGGGAPGSGGVSAGGMGGPDAAMPKDAVAPDLAPIPDAPVRLDAPLTFWTTSYTANCTPPAIGGRAQADGHHRAGEDCMRSGCHLNPKKPEHHAGTDCRGSGCHANGSPDGSGAPAFLFGGTVYRAVTLAADPGVEVSVKAASTAYSACSASNGNFWVSSPTGTTSITWAGASTRLRNANGEAPMMGTPAAGCNATTCHTGILKMTSP